VRFLIPFTLRIASSTLFETSQYLLKQTMQDKTTEFFKTIRDLMALISTENGNNILCNIILLVNLLRVILLPLLYWRWWAAGSVAARRRVHIAIMGRR